MPGMHRCVCWPCSETLHFPLHSESACKKLWHQWWIELNTFLAQVVQISHRNIPGAKQELSWNGIYSVSVPRQSPLGALALLCISKILGCGKWWTVLPWGSSSNTSLMLMVPVAKKVIMALNSVHSYSYHLPYIPRAWLLLLCPSALLVTDWQGDSRKLFQYIWFAMQTFLLLEICSLRLFNGDFKTLNGVVFPLSAVVFPATENFHYVLLFPACFGALYLSGGPFPLPSLRV